MVTKLKNKPVNKTAHPENILIANTKIKSWSFLLSILPDVIHEKDRAKKLNQDSPLRFASQEEAQSFGKRMFEPPLSVIKWSVVGSMEPANFPIENKLTQ